MTIKWIDNGDNSGWEVWAGNSRRRLFVARKHGGKEATLQAARAEEQTMKAALPPRWSRIQELAQRFFRRAR